MYKVYFLVIKTGKETYKQSEAEEVGFSRSLLSFATSDIQPKQESSEDYTR